MHVKKKWPRAAALDVAQELVAALTPFCTRIEVAGSLRRKKPDVGDVEILFIPQIDKVQVGFFETDIADANRAEEEIDRLLRRRVILKRVSVNGAAAWGEKNKLAVHARSGIPVDLFATTEDSWFNYLVCRTGPAELNVAICNAAQQKGWKWNPYGAGFSRIGHIEPMKSERAVFEFVGLPYSEPEHRR